MSTEKIFKTKNGYCHVLPENIVFTKDGTVGRLSQVSTANNNANNQLYLGIVGVVFGAISVSRFISSEFLGGIISLILMLIMIVGIILSRNKSTTNLIQRNDIIRVEHKSKTALQGSKIEILFSDQKKKELKRDIILEGKDQISRAIEIFKEEQLL